MVTGRPAARHSSPAGQMIMTLLKTEARISLPQLHDYLAKIIDRIASFDAKVEQDDDRLTFAFGFGHARFLLSAHGLHAIAEANDERGLARLKEILAGAIQLYAKVDAPEIIWTGDCSQNQDLASFRLMRVISAIDVTARMRRIRLAGPDLGRFRDTRGMHIRILFPTLDIPDPVWPIAGADGLTLWPDPSRKPAARVYTIRKLDVEAGWMDVDFVIHPDENGQPTGIGATWATCAQEGQEVGVIGPLGRPVRDADWYLMGCDETGLPALSRILENLPTQTSGIAFVEIADRGEKQAIDHPQGVEIRWLYRDRMTTGLADAVMAVEWPTDKNTFGWFASEGKAAAQVRDHWRNTLGFGRDQTLAAAYWKAGQSGVMAGN